MNCETYPNRDAADRGPRRCLTGVHSCAAETLIPKSCAEEKGLSQILHKSVHPMLVNSRYVQMTSNTFLMMIDFAWGQSNNNTLPYGIFGPVCVCGSARIGCIDVSGHVQMRKSFGTIEREVWTDKHAPHLNDRSRIVHIHQRSLQDFSRVDVRLRLVTLSSLLFLQPATLGIVLPQLMVIVRWTSGLGGSRNAIQGRQKFIQGFGLGSCGLSPVRGG